MGIGNTLNQLIKLRGTNVNELSQKIGVAPTTIYSLIKRDSKKVDIEILIKLSKALNVNAEYFYNCEMADNTLNNKESILLEHYNKLNDLGKDEAIKRVSELTEINKYTECKEINTLEDLNPELIAAHDDDLTADEKAEADKRILEAIKKIKK